MYGELGWFKGTVCRLRIRYEGEGKYTAYETKLLQSLMYFTLKITSK